jgi:hypothetical protein
MIQVFQNLFRYALSSINSHLQDNKADALQSSTAEKIPPFLDHTRGFLQNPEVDMKQLDLWCLRS